MTGDSGLLTVGPKAVVGDVLGEISPEASPSPHQLAVGENGLEPLARVMFAPEHGVHALHDLPKAFSASAEWACRTSFSS